LTFQGWLGKVGIRSERTAQEYALTVRRWARSRGFESPDEAIADIKTRGLDPYQLLQEYVTGLHNRKLAPASIHVHFSAVKRFLNDCDIEVTSEKVRNKIILPSYYLVSTDRAPTKAELKQTLLRSKLKTKVAIELMGSSGIRIGEAATLRVCDIDFGKVGQASKIMLKAKTTKSRKKRVTFISPEATEILRQYLGERIKQPDDYIFLRTKEEVDTKYVASTLYKQIIYAFKIAGLRIKEDSESPRYSLHPHCLRKFFHTNCLAAGIDRGVVEGFMGHTFALDSSYLRMTDDELRGNYMKAVDRLTFLTTPELVADNEEVQGLRDEVAKLRGQFETILKTKFGAERVN
jgi:integrase